jgi:hypothetical protein
MSRNMLNWFLCGLTTGLITAAAAASVAYAVIVYGGSVDTIPAFGTALAFGALCYTLRRENRGRGDPLPFISRERKARLPGRPVPNTVGRHGLRKTAC